LLFKFRLADRWGCSVEELEDRLPQKELVYWFAFFQMAPFGGDVLDAQFAQVCSILAEPHRNPKKRSSPFEAEDFKFAKKHRAKPKKTVVEQFKALVKLLGG
jgi:hypothetical protein